MMGTKHEGDSGSKLEGDAGNLRSKWAVTYFCRLFQMGFHWTQRYLIYQLWQFQIGGKLEGDFGSKLEGDSGLTVNFKVTLVPQ